MKTCCKCSARMPGELMPGEKPYCGKPCAVVPAAAAPTPAKRIVVSWENREPVLRVGGRWVRTEEPDGQVTRRITGGSVVAVGTRQVSQALALLDYLDI